MADSMFSTGNSIAKKMCTTTVTVSPMKMPLTTFLTEKLLANRYMNTAKVRR